MQLSFSEEETEFQIKFDVPQKLYSGSKEALSLSETPLFPCWRTKLRFGYPPWCHFTWAIFLRPAGLCDRRLLFVSSMNTRLHPSFVRAAASVIAWLLLLIPLTYLFQPRLDYRSSTTGFAIALLSMPLFVCVIWVPSQLEFSATHLTIRFPFRPLYTVPWDDLEYYGWFKGVYGLQFHGTGVFTFYPQALPRSEWSALKNFLSTTFPERKAGGAFGNRLHK